MKRLQQMIREVHRCSLWQVLGIYLAGAWLTLQVAREVTVTLGLPEWVPPLAFVVLVIGLPVVLATAFVQEGVPGPERDSSALIDAGGRELRRSAGPVRRTGSRARRLFTWRNALWVGAGGFALVGVITGGYMAMRTLGIGPPGTLIAKGAVPEDATVLVADFAGEDRELAAAVTEALRVDVGRSPVVKVAAQARVADAFRRMRRPADEVLDRSTALELAAREGMPVVATGAVARAGAGYVLTARLLSSSDGDELASFRAAAEDAEGVIPAIEKLGHGVRERIGESLRSVRHSPKLAHVTTSSLRALQLYSAGLRVHFREGAQERSLSLFREAIGLDPQFASAHLALAVAILNAGGSPSEAHQALTKAFELRDRLPPEERVLTELEYHAVVDDDARRVVEAGENRLAMVPEDYTTLILVGDAYGRLGDRAREEASYLRAIEADSSKAVVPYTNVAQLRIDRGEFDGAREILTEARRQGFDHPWMAFARASAAANEGDFAAAAETLRDLLERHPGEPFLTAAVGGRLGDYAAVRGRIDEALRRYGEAMEASAGAGVGLRYLRLALRRASVHLVLRSDTAAALAGVREALVRYSLEDLEPLDRPYVFLIDAYGRAGRTRRASELLAAFERARRSVDPAPPRGPLDVARGLVAIAEGRFGEGLEVLRSSDVGDCTACTSGLLSWAYDRAGMADSALVHYRRFVETPSYGKFAAPFAASRFPLALERLGDLYAERGETEEALRHYRRFVDLWENCGPDLRPRVERARNRIEALTASATG